MLSKNLTRILKQKGISLSEIARQTRVPKATLHSWTVGQKSVNLEQLKKVAEFLNVSVALLAYGEEDMAAEKSTEMLKELFSGDLRVTIKKIERIPKKL